MVSPIASAIVLLMLTAPSPAALPETLVATPDNAEPVRLHVGNTAIRCTTLPCPTRALFVPDARGHAASDRMLYADLDGKAPPPPMIGDMALLAAITSAWEERTCLAIDGRLISGEDDRPVLRVDQVIGPCKERPE